MKKAVSAITILVLLFALAVPCFAAEDVQVTSESAFLVDIDTGRVMYEKNADVRVTAGTLTKIMVALVVLENVEDLSQDVTVSDLAYNNAINKGNGGPNAYLAKGEVLSVDDLLAILMVRSGLDASNALAEFTTGSLTSFIALMNTKAAELGCTNTNFVNASGAENPSQYTSARDMALILKAALENERFMEYAYLTKVYVANEGYPVHSLSTSNRLVNADYEEYYYNAAKGVAYTQLNDNTNSLATVLKKGSSQYICVVLGGGVNSADLKESFLDAKALGEWVFTSFKTATLADGGKIICDEAIDLCEQTDRLNLMPVADVTALVPSDADLEAVTTSVEYYGSVPFVAPVTKGDVVGKMIFSLDGEVLAEVELAAAISLEYSEKLAAQKERLEFMRSPIFIILVVVALIVIALIAVVIVVLVKRNTVDGFSRRRR